MWSYIAKIFLYEILFVCLFGGVGDGGGGPGMIQMLLNLNRIVTLKVRPWLYIKFMDLTSQFS